MHAPTAVSAAVSAAATMPTATGRASETKSGRH
jgi:hypothetical protein